MLRPKLQDVALRAGVSVTTVSRVLNNRGYLSDDVRSRVHTAIDEVGYRPHHVARALRGQKTYVVGVVVPTVADPFFGELVAAIEGTLAKSGYRVMLCDCHHDAGAEAEYLELLQTSRVDGIITSTHNVDAERAYAGVDVPIVAVDRMIGERSPTIGSDNLAGGRMATEHLIERGSTAPVLLTASDHHRNDRARGYRDVVAAHGIEPRIFAYGYTAPLEQRRADVERWLSRTRPDGVFATDDLTALIVLAWARSEGLRVPEDVRIVGYDGSAAVRFGAPGLTTVHQPITAMAEHAARLVVARSDDPDALIPNDEPLPVHLRIGWTS